MAKKELKLNESEFKKLVRGMVRKSIMEHLTRPQKKAEAKKLSVNEFRNLVRESVMEVMKEEAAAKLQEKGGKWMQKAVHPSKKGNFTAKAKKAGMSVQQYAKHVLANTDDFSEETVNQAKFAKAAKSVSK